jgi:hypothetical protein
MKVKPLLGDWEIPHIEIIRTAEQRNFVEMAVPGRVGSTYQDMNTSPTNIVIVGSLYGDEARDEFLETVRDKFKSGEPLTFVADIITATEIQYVIIESLRFEENGARTDQMDYVISLKESPPPPPPPDPLGGLDAGLLDQAAGFVEGVTGALDALDALANVPNFGDPTEPLSGALDGVGAALGSLGDITGALDDLFGA